MATALISGPLAMLLVRSGDATMAYVFNFIYQLFSPFWIGSAVALANELVVPRMRATASAYYILAVTFIGLFLNEDYQDAIIAIAVLYAVALLYFAIWGRHKLVLSPEEEYAMSGGLHRDPEVEHYGSSELEGELPPEDFEAGR